MNDNTKAEGTCTIKKQALVDVTVEAEFPWATSYTWGNPLAQARALERAVKEFEEFLRDHRSQDVVTLSIQRVYQDLCSACGREFEEMEDYKDEGSGKTFCAWCGAQVTEEVPEEPKDNHE